MSTRSTAVGGGAPEGPWEPGGHGTSRIDDGLHCAALTLRLRPVIPALCQNLTGQSTLTSPTTTLEIG